MVEPPLIIRPVEGHGLATIMARKGVSPATIGKALGVEAPEGPRSAVTGKRRLVGIGPDTWLLMEDAIGPEWIAGIERCLVGLASVTEQSSGFALLDISGPSARAVLQKGLAIDLHPDAFPAGAAATSTIDHIGVTFWCVATNSFQIATFRSYGRDFRRWLEETATMTESARERTE